MRRAPAASPRGIRLKSRRVSHSPARLILCTEYSFLFAMLCSSESRCIITQNRFAPTRGRGLKRGEHVETEDAVRTCGLGCSKGEIVRLGVANAARGVAVRAGQMSMPPLPNGSRRARGTILQVGRAAARAFEPTQVHDGDGDGTPLIMKGCGDERTNCAEAAANPRGRGG